MWFGQSAAFGSRETSEDWKEQVKVVEGLALRKPRRSVATIQRQVSAIALQQGWQSQVMIRCITIKELSPALVTLAQEGTGTYREEYDLLYRREAEKSNDIWQADHCQLPIWLRDPQGKRSKPWLTVIEDDKSRAISGYRFSWSAPSAIQTALTLRQAIWRKEDPRWQVCGIPQILYTDHGKDFTSVHLEQVGADLKMQLIFSQCGLWNCSGAEAALQKSGEGIAMERPPELQESGQFCIGAASKRPPCVGCSKGSHKPIHWRERRAVYFL